MGHRRRVSVVGVVDGRGDIDVLVNVLVRGGEGQRGGLSEMAVFVVAGVKGVTGQREPPA